jgi:hypothetical protein
MGKKIISLFVSVIILYGCSSKGTIFEVIDLSRDTTFIATTTNILPSAIILKVTGQANDTFLLQGFIKVPGGKIDQEIQQDFYGKAYHIRYSSYRATSGRLQISYVVP